MARAMEPALSIRTSRLELVACTLPLVRAASRSDRAEFAQLLDASISDEWPPELFDDAALEYMVRALEADPGLGGWGFWFVLSRPQRDAIGIVGCKGRPEQGRVDVGFSILPARRKFGYATEALTALLDWVWEDASVQRVVGETLEGHAASIRVMQKCGFEYVGTGLGHDEGDGLVEQYQRLRTCGNALSRATPA